MLKKKINKRQKELMNPHNKTITKKYRMQILLKLEETLVIGYGSGTSSVKRLIDTILRLKVFIKPTPFFKNFFFQKKLHEV